MRRRIRSTIASVAAAAALCISASGVADDDRPALDDDAGGLLESVRVSRALDVPSGASIDLVMDVEYRYETTTLLGDPLLLCGARVGNTRGEVRFIHDGREHSVAVDAANAHLVQPYHLDLMARYSRDQSSFFAACNTGILGTETTEPFNLASAPAWDALFCGARDVQGWPVAGQARDMPAMLRAGWCAAAGLRHVEADQAKALFSPGPFRADAFYVAGLSVSVHDLILEARKALLAQARANRYTARIRAAAEKAARARPDGFADRNGTAALADRARSGLTRVAALSDPFDQVRAAREVLDALSDHWRDSSDSQVPVLRSIQADLARARDEDSDFRDRQRRLAEAMAADHAKGVAETRAHLASQRQLVETAPEFRRPDETTPKHVPGLVSLTLVIDVSGSMSGTRLEAAKSAAIEAVRRAASAGRAEFAIFSFAGTCAAPKIDSLPFTGDVAAAERFIAGLKAGGGTPLTPSVGIANRYVGSSRDPESAAQLVVLLADGDDDCGGLDAEVETLRRQGFLFRHETIGLEIAAESAAARQLRALARRSGGAYHEAHTTAQLSAAFENAVASVQLLDLLGLFGGRAGAGGGRATGQGSGGGGERPGLSPDLLRALDDR